MRWIRTCLVNSLTEIMSSVKQNIDFNENIDVIVMGSRCGAVSSQRCTQPQTIPLPIVR
jgi:hypothetical protein